MCTFVCSALVHLKADLPKLPWQFIKFVGYGIVVYVFSLSYWGNLARCHIFDRDGCKPRLTISFGVPIPIDSNAVDKYSLFPGINPPLYPKPMNVTIEVADAGVSDLIRASLIHR